jgi:hypothetical protein
MVQESLQDMLEWSFLAVSWNSERRNQGLSIAPNLVSYRHQLKLVYLNQIP